MSDLLQRTLAWKMVIFKGAILVIINMGTVLIASMQGWTKEYVDGLGWWSWVVLVMSVVVSGLNTTAAYMDKTFHIEGDQVQLANAKVDAEPVVDKPINEEGSK